MKKIYLLPSAMVIISFIVAFFLWKYDYKEPFTINTFTPREIWNVEYLEKKEKRKNGYNKADKPDQFTKYFKDITTRIGESRQGFSMNYQTIELEKAKEKFKINHHLKGSLNWISRGPANVGGRTRALVIDPDDPEFNTWYAGAASGGIWKTTDGGMNWLNLSDNFTNLSITSLEMAPSNHNVLLAGTGESFPGGTFMSGNGIWKSTDRGQSWIQLINTANDIDFAYINKIVIDPANENLIFAATESGVFKSTNGGDNWSQVFSSIFGVEDLDIDPLNANVLLACNHAVGVFRTENAGNDWSFSSAGLETGTRFELSISPVDHNIVYASVNVSTTESKVFTSYDNGKTWKRFNDDQNFLGGQGDYDNTIQAHPYNVDEVYVGGVDLWKLKFNGAITESEPKVINAYTVNADFLSFVNFGGAFLNGGMSISEGILVNSSDWLTVEVRFGSGITQKAHRFVVPDLSTSGVPAASYSYVDYVDVPFQVWDVKNNQQLMVSFRDQEKDTVFNLYERNGEDYGELGREYIFVNALPYSETPDSRIAVKGGHLFKNLYMFWQVLADGSIWNPDNLPDSKIVVDYGTVSLISGVKNNTADAYGNYGGINSYDQNAGFGTTIIPGLHPDHHNIKIIPLGNGNVKIIEANDGGLGISVDNGIVFKQLPNNYITTQFYGVARHPNKKEYMGGMQDNGSWKSPKNVDASLNTPYLFQIGGDGFECLWNTKNPDYLIGSSYNNRLKKTLNGGSTWTEVSGITQDDGPFITKLSASKENPDLIFAVGGQGVYRSTSFGSSWINKKINTNWAVNNEVTSSHRVEVSQSNGNIVWAGGGMAKEFGLQMQVSVDEGLTFKTVSEYSLVAMNAYISGLSTHPNEDSTAYVLFSLSGYPKVLITKNLGKSWEDLSGFGTDKVSSNGFPDVIVHCLLVMPDNPDVIWVGTEIGLFESTNNGESWHFANNGLPPVPIYQMKAIGDEVVIATHGRGIWSVAMPEFLNVPYISEFKQNSGLELTLTANMQVAYDSVHVYLNNAFNTTLFNTGVGINSIPIVVNSGGEYISFIKGFKDGNSYKSNSIDLLLKITGITDQQAENQFQLYPNPARNYFTFNLDMAYNWYKIELFSMTGTKVYFQALKNNGSNRINVDFLPTGAYFVNIYFEEKRISKVLLIER